MGVVIGDSFRAASDRHVEHFVMCGIEHMRCKLTICGYISGLIEIPIKTLGSCQIRRSSLQVNAILLLATASRIFLAFGKLTSHLLLQPIV